MRRSDLLRVQDVRNAYRLIGECRDLGSDPALWQARMFTGLCQLVGAPTATGGEGFWVRSTHSIRPLSVFDVGLGARYRQLYTNYLREVTAQRDPILCALADVPGRVLTRRRSAVVSDALWYGSADFNDYRKPGGIDHCLASIYEVSPQGGIDVVCLHRALGERDFSPGEVRLLEFFHQELGPLVGRQLVSATEPNTTNLPPRLRQTLACLLEGDSEKQVAARLRLSQATVHQYVTALYRRFGVRSRAELLTNVLRRRPRTEWAGSTENRYGKTV